MSEMIDEVLVDHIPDVAPDFPMHRVHFMLDTFRDKDVYLECKGCTPYLIVREAESRYAFFGHAADARLCRDAQTNDSNWSEYIGRSYKIIRDTGALPYAHRS